MRFTKLPGRAFCPPLLLHFVDALRTHCNLAAMVNSLRLRPRSRAALCALLAWREALAVLYCSHQPILSALRHCCILLQFGSEGEQTVPQTPQQGSTMRFAILAGGACCPPLFLFISPPKPSALRPCGNLAARVNRVCRRPQSRAALCPS